MTTIEVDSYRFELNCLAEITYHLNGERTAKVSVSIENVTKEIQKIRVNLTKTVSGETLSSKVSSAQNAPLQASYSGPLIEYKWDGLYALLAPGNYTDWVKYDHDNNYFRYYPKEWNRNWEMEGTEKLHIQLSAPDTDAWLKEEISNADVWSRLARIGSAFAGGLLGGLIAATLKEPMSLKIALAGICAALGAALDWILELLGLKDSKPQWIQNTVMAAHGEGHAYAWGFNTIYASAFMANPLLGLSIRGPNDMHLILQHHRVLLLMWETTEFFQNWGAERGSPGDRYTVEKWYSTLVNPGIFGTSDSDYGSDYW